MKNRVTWSQSTPGRGVESATIERQGTVLRREGDTVYVRPDDAPNSTVMMRDPALPPAAPSRPKRSKTALGHEKNRYAKNL